MTGQVAVSQSKHKICDACRHSPRRKDHLTPLLRATQNGHPACLQAIVHHIDINKEDLSYLLDEISPNGKTAVALAAKYRYHECIELLALAGANMDIAADFPPILEATLKGNAKCIDALLEGGAKVDIQCTTMEDLIELACREGQTRCARVQTKTGAELDAEITTAEAALYCSVANCDLPCLIALVGGGICVNLGSTTYVTPLMVSAAAGSRGLTCLKMLLTVGANVNEVNKYGMNALDLCLAHWDGSNRDNSEKCMFLLAAGERIEVDDKDWFICKGRRDKKYRINAYVRITHPKLCLKHFCRRTIREYMIDLSPHSHLFGRIPELRLPSRMTRYLLYEMSLD